MATSDSGTPARDHDAIDKAVKSITHNAAGSLTTDPKPAVTVNGSSEIFLPISISSEAGCVENAVMPSGSASMATIVTDQSGQAVLTIGDDATDGNDDVCIVTTQCADLIAQNQVLSALSSTTEQSKLVVQGEAFTSEAAEQSALTSANTWFSADGQVMMAHAGDGDSQLQQPLVISTPTLDASGNVTVADSSALQGLLTGQGTSQFITSTGETFQVITLSNPNDLEKYVQVASGEAVAGGDACNIGLMLGDRLQRSQDTDDEQMSTQEVGAEVVEIIRPPSGILSRPGANFLSTINTILPPGAPTWASRLRDCQRLGDYYRGWVESEQELDLLLTYHKQETHTLWGTRQSPCPAKPSTRLMWKSQYVPFDGIPFLNSGSRAIVMECQYGPRRKGAQIRKHGDAVLKEDFRQTCPARIYIKKVRKFPAYRVNPDLDKKALKIAMDKAFLKLKDMLTEMPGEDRFYLQLPVEGAHEFHDNGIEINVPPAVNPRLDTRVAMKIREMVAAGETKLYVVRKALRKFVEKDLLDLAGNPPEKHNLSFFPTVNDLQNHIHQAIRDIEAGVLPVTAQTVNVEVIASSESVGDTRDLNNTMWQTVSSEQPHAETVTVTLTQQPEDGQHIISKVETQMSDGTTEVSSTLTPETARLLSKLHPNMFPACSLIQAASEPTSAMAVMRSGEGTAVSVEPIAMVPSEVSHPMDISDGTEHGEGLVGMSMLGVKEAPLSEEDTSDMVVSECSDSQQPLTVALVMSESSTVKEENPEIAAFCDMDGGQSATDNAFCNAERRLHEEDPD